MSGEELLSEYLASNPRIKSKGTERLLRFALKQFGRYLGRPSDAADFTDKNLVGFMRYRRETKVRGKQIAEATLEHEAAKLAAIGKYAAHLGLVPPLRFTVTHQRPGTTKAMLDHQIRKLFHSALSAKHSIGGIPEKIYFPAVFAIIWDTGERIGAIHKLERRDIDLERLEIRFRFRKGGHESTRPIRRSTAKAIERLLTVNPSDRPMAPVIATSLYHHLNRILEAAGIPKDRKLKFHALRKSHASYYKAAGGDATASLGHSSDAVTLKHYIDPKIVAGKTPTELLFDPLGFSPLRWVNRLASKFGLWSIFTMLEL